MTFLPLKGPKKTTLCEETLSLIQTELFFLSNSLKKYRGKSTASLCLQTDLGQTTNFEFFWGEKKHI